MPEVLGVAEPVVWLVGEVEVKESVSEEVLVSVVLDRLVVLSVVVLVWLDWLLVLIVVAVQDVPVWLAEVKVTVIVPVVTV